MANEATNDGETLEARLNRLERLVDELLTELGDRMPFATLEGSEELSESVRMRRGER